MKWEGVLTQADDIKYKKQTAIALLYSLTLVYIIKENTILGLALFYIPFFLFYIYLRSSLRGDENEKRKPNDE